MFWPWEIVERDHELQNPTSAEKIRRLGNYLRLGSESRVLDIACGKGGPALILAAEHGCRITGIEIRAEFADDARRRATDAGLDSLIEVQTADASTVELPVESFDAALCLGAAFVWGTIADAAAALRPAIRSGGSAAIGEPFWRRWPVPEGIDAQDYVALDETAGRFTRAGFALTGMIAASEDDWDNYECLHWRAVEEWLAANPEHPEAAGLRATHERRRSDYFRYKRALFGWAIFVGRKI